MVLSTRAILLRISVTTAAVLLVGAGILAAAAGAFTSTGHTVSTSVRQWERCTVMQARPCTRLSPSVLAADTGLSLPAGASVLSGQAGRYFPREDRFELVADVSIPAGTRLAPAAGVALTDQGFAADGRHLYQVSMQISSHPNPHG